MVPQQKDDHMRKWMALGLILALAGCGVPFVPIV